MFLRGALKNLQMSHITGLANFFNMQNTTVIFVDIRYVAIPIPVPMVLGDFGVEQYWYRVLLVLIGIGIGIGINVGIRYSCWDLVFLFVFAFILVFVTADFLTKKSLLD